VSSFAFLTNHVLALLCIAEDPRVRMRDIATAVNITERAAQRIVSDLIDAGYVDRRRDGRRNEYSVRTDLPLALPNRRHIDIGSLLAVLLGSSAPSRSESDRDGGGGDDGA
jgi:hypothetical protein